MEEDPIYQVNNNLFIHFELGTRNTFAKIFCFMPYIISEQKA